MTPGFVYLASQSPRRRAAARRRSACATSCCSPTPTRTPRRSRRRAPASSPAAYVERVTRAKLRRRASRACARAACRAAPILCADTTVALGRRILGKPADAADAARMLALLSGRTHRVITAVAVAARGAQRGSRASVSRVRFAPLAPRADRALRRQRRAVRQGRRLRDPERGRGLDRAHRGQLHRYHGLAAVRDGRAARLGGRRGPALDQTRAADPTMQDILINWSPQETRVAVVENGAVQELHVERTLERGLVGNIYTRQGRARAARHAVGVHRHRPGARRLPARGRRLRQRRHARAATTRPGRGAAAADRAHGLRGPDADGAGDQGPDRHQGRAAVDADQHRRAPARLPAAGRPHRHLAEDRLARAARAAARAHAALLGRRAGATASRRRLHPAHQRRRGERRRAGRRHRLPAQDLGARSASAPSSRRRARCCTRT